MSEDEKYRQLAGQCLMLANMSSNRQVRAIALHMAKEWLRLADQERQKGQQIQTNIRRRSPAS